MAANIDSSLSSEEIYSSSSESEPESEPESGVLYNENGKPIHVRGKKETKCKFCKIYFFSLLLLLLLLLLL